jgi:hypothetical protein
MRKSSATTNTAATLSPYDAGYNAALEPFAVAGAQTHVVARASVAHLKRGTSATAGFSVGAFHGFIAGWKSVK